MSRDSDSDAAAPPTLASLRASLDVLDHALVDLLAERRARVRELFALKRREGLPLYDPVREAALIADRLERGAEHGVPPELVLAVFRAILQTSRDEAGAPTAP
ncbi:MAG: chorismate mutase [Myxococcales bacterium]|nr:chorismate mutase [Myxococcales bacterium]